MNQQFFYNANHYQQQETLHKSFLHSNDTSQFYVSINGQNIIIQTQSKIYIRAIAQIRQCINQYFYNSLKLIQIIMELEQGNLLTESQVLNIPQSFQNIPEEFNLSLSNRNSQQQEDYKYRQFALRWIFSYPRNIATNTRYLATSYLFKLKDTIKITKQNYEKLAVTVLLLACKLNQIHPPKIEKMIAECKTTIKKEQIFEIEGQLLHHLNFNIAFEETTYSRLYNILGTRYENILQKAQKLLRTVTLYNEIYAYGQQTLVYSVIFAILPNIIKEINLEHDELEIVRELALKIHRRYKSQKTGNQKQNKILTVKPSL